MSPFHISLPNALLSRFTATNLKEELFQVRRGSVSLGETHAHEEGLSAGEFSKAKIVEGQAGLSEEEFAAVVKAVTGASQKTCSLLFRKMDANADGALHWKEFLTYLIKESSNKISLDDARGAFVIDDMPVDGDFMCANASAGLLKLASRHGDDFTTRFGGTKITASKSSEGESDLKFKCTTHITLKR